DVDQGYHAAEGRERIVPAVDRTATCVGSYGSPQRRVSNAESNFLTLRVSAGLRCRGLLVYRVRIKRVAVSFRPVRNGDTGDEQNRHRRPYCPSMALRARHTSQGVRESRTNRENCDQLDEIR